MRRHFCFISRTCAIGLLLLTTACAEPSDAERPAARLVRLVDLGVNPIHAAAAAIPADEIQDAADVPQSTLYAFFPRGRALQREIVDPRLARMRTALGESVGGLAPTWMCSDVTAASFLARAPEQGQLVDYVEDEVRANALRWPDEAARSVAVNELSAAADEVAHTAASEPTATAVLAMLTCNELSEAV